jgi:hypothetical protein
MSWLTEHSGAVTTVTNYVINYIPVVATVVTSILSLVLARATLRQVEATDKGLALARAEFEREWAPELHIKLRRLSATDVEIVVTNLAKVSVLLQVVQFRNLSTSVPFDRWILNDPLIGGTSWTDNVSKRLLTMTGHEFEGVIDASATFFAAGRMYRTDWFRFNTMVHNGHFLRMDAVNVVARRVKVDHVHEETISDSELGRDVVGAENKPVRSEER